MAKNADPATRAQSWPSRQARATPRNRAAEIHPAIDPPRPAAQILGDIARHFGWPGAQAHYEQALVVADRAGVALWREAALKGQAALRGQAAPRRLDNQG